MSNDQSPPVTGPAADHSVNALTAEEAVIAAEAVRQLREARAVLAEYEQLPTDGYAARMVRGSWLQQNGRRLERARSVLGRGGK
jgi:hypothetical protein